MSTIIRRIYPFVAADIVQVAVLVTIPAIAHLLPSMMR
jgi:TRAP-type C4-dicarboxylate transport system permease large subunit